MRIGVRVQYVDKRTGEMKLFSYVEYTYKASNVGKPIRRWYKYNPYAKRISKHWICQDYRIDQQRPQRNVYSEAYLKIVEITEMEENVLDEIIEELEKDRDYPTVWDDGKNSYYEDTIHCPNCGKRRKVLTSETHCEFCGFEFCKALKCPKCKDLSLKNSNYCIHCGYDFNLKKKKKIYDEVIRCPKCGCVKSKDSNFCRNCFFDFSNKKQCPKCKRIINDEDRFCNYCSQEQIGFVECNNCSKKNNMDNNFCTKCGEVI